jgi:hypothetical protein
MRPVADDEVPVGSRLEILIEASPERAAISRRMINSLMNGPAIMVLPAPGSSACGNRSG